MSNWLDDMFHNFWNSILRNPLGKIIILGIIIFIVIKLVF